MIAPELVPANSRPRSARLAEEFADKDYRDNYVETHSRQFLARQMRAFRDEQSQTEFGERIERRQTVISRLEDPNYSGWNLQTLFDIARRMNVAVLVRFVDFPTFLRFTKNMSPADARPDEYDQNAIDEVAQEDEAAERRSALREFFKDLRQERPSSTALSPPPAPPSPPPQSAAPASASPLAERPPKRPVSAEELAA